jgi:hypothetical protein
MIEKRKPLNKILPPTAINEDVLTQIKKIAKREDVKVSVVVRSAIQLFLAQYDSNTFKG